MHEPFPRLSPEEKTKERHEMAKYKEASDQVSFVEDMAGRHIAGYDLGAAWNHAWDVVNDLPPSQGLQLKDRLLVCHPRWEKLEDDLEKIRNLRAEVGRSVRIASLEQSVDGMSRWLNEQEEESLHSASPRARAKVRWFEQRIKEEENVSARIEENNEMKPRHTDPLSTDNGRGAILHSMQTPILNTVAETKQKRLQKEMARSDQKAVQSERQTVTFQIERELGASHSSTEVAKIMTRINNGTFRVGALNRFRDWFSTKLGRMAGHADTPSLHELVEQHRQLSEKLKKIQEVLNNN